MERVPVPLDPKIASVINRTVGVIALVAGLTFILGGGFVIHHNHLDEFILQRAVAEGLVVENRSKEVHPGSGSRALPFTSYQAVVNFTDRHGQTVTYADAFGFGSPSFRVGQEVRIFYDPQNSQHAMIDRGPKNFVVPLVCAVFGGFMLLGAVQRLSHRT
jgi:Protein of unknown function (DUF3592)